MSSFAGELRKLRRAAGLSQEALAQRAGLSPEGVSLLERGRRSPRLTTIRLLADAMYLSERDRSALLATVADPGPAFAPLPVYPERLVGRDQIISNLLALVGRPEVRTVTVVGPGGIGKTRVVVAVAERAEFTGGVFWLPAGSLVDPAAWASALGSVVGLSGTGPVGTPELTEHLAGLQCLLVIDNAERHAAGWVELCSALLARAPGVKFLISSRHLLDLPGEHAQPLPPLEPDDAALLFRQRSGLHEADEQEVRRICTRLDGLPLALELAAARTRVLTLSELADALDEAPLILAADDRAPELTESIVGWSYRLLNPDEQVVFSRLSVFAGGFGRDAVAAVCAADRSPAQILDVLSSLVAKALVVRRDDGRPMARFRLLHLVGQYASDRLSEHGDAEDVRRRHAAYFCELVETCAPHLVEHDQQEWLAVLDREVANLRRALAWSIAAEPTTALRIIGGLWRWCYLRGRYAEGRAWAMSALAAAPDGPTRERTAALAGAGMLAFLECDYEAAENFIREAERGYADTGDETGLAWALSRLGGIARERGAYDLAIDRHTRALAIAERLGDQHAAATQLNFLAFVSWLRGEPGAATARATAALDRLTASGDREGIVWALMNCGAAAYYLGDDEAAELQVRRALELSQEFDFREGIAWSHNQLGLLARERGDLAAALALQQASLTGHHELGDRWRMASAHDELAAILLARGELIDAAAHLGAADRLRREIDTPVPYVERPARERTESALRTALGNAYDSAVRTGAALERSARP